MLKVYNQSRVWEHPTSSADISTYLQALQTRSQNGSSISSLEEISSVYQKERKSFPHSVPLILVLPLLPITQLLFLFVDGSLHQAAALQQSRVEAPELVSGIQLGGRRWDSNHAAITHVCREVLPLSLKNRRQKRTEGRNKCEMGREGESLKVKCKPCSFWQNPCIYNTCQWGWCTIQVNSESFHRISKKNCECTSSHLN